MADHVFAPSAVSKQVGAAVILKVFEQRKLWPVPMTIGDVEAMLVRIGHGTSA